MSGLDIFSMSVIIVVVIIAIGLINLLWRM